MLPFLYVSGTMGEEAAVQALREGADDYILKDQPVRLPSAAARAIREARHLVEHERVEKELLRSQRLDCLAMLAAGLSHDLRNILQPLLIVPDLLKTRSDDPRIHQLADVISECGLRGNEMAESMLSVKSRLVINALLEQFRFFLLPFFQRLNGRKRVERTLRNLLVVSVHIALKCHLQLSR